MKKTVLIDKKNLLIFKKVMFLNTYLLNTYLPKKNFIGTALTCLKALLCQCEITNFKKPKLIHFIAKLPQ